MRDTLKINGVRVGKLLLEVPVRELHNSMIAPVDEGGLACVRNEANEVTVGDSSLRSCLLYTSPSPRDATLSRMPSSA